MGRRQLPVAKRRRFDPKRLEHELHEGRSDSLLYQVIRRYARMQDNGVVIMRCFPSVAETDPAKKHHSIGKVIYDTVEQARDCVLELLERNGDVRASFIYPCNRSKHGHVHTTSQKTHGVLMEVRPDGSTVDRRPSVEGQ